jgi:DNA excision repair protein ERCC-5
MSPTVIPIPANNTHTVHDDKINESTKENTDTDELSKQSDQEAVLTMSKESLANLAEEEHTLTEAMNRNQRDMDTVTDEMKEEIIQLLQLFGVPYLEAPAEAEAQCVALEDLGLVDGIVTEDSDVFVFGGKNVYRNIFDDQKYVEVYKSADAKRDLALERNHLVALAMLLGGKLSHSRSICLIIQGILLRFVSSLFVS